QIDRLKLSGAHEHRGASAIGASAMPLHNDGVFPRTAQFLPIDPITASRMDACAHSENHGSRGDTTIIGGPCVLLEAKALAQVGVPRTDYDSTDACLADWSLRAAALGHRRVCVYGVFVATQNTDSATKEDQNKLRARFKERVAPGDDIGLAAAKERTELAFYRENLRVPLPMAGDYSEWAQLFDTAHPASTVTDGPVIGVVITGDGDAEKSIESVQKQTYGNWVLQMGEYSGAVPDDPRIRRLDASVSWICFLTAGDTLSTNALDEVAKAIRDNTDASFLYSDCDEITTEGVRQNPFFKPGFDYERLLCHHYTDHLSVYHSGLIDEIPDVLDAARRYDFALKFYEKIDRRQVHHIARVLYHRRSDSVKHDHGTKESATVVANHLNRTGQQAMVVPNQFDQKYHGIQFGIPAEMPLVTIIIPTKDRMDLIYPCLQSLIGKTVYPNYEVIVVDNGSTDKDVLRYLNQVAKDHAAPGNQNVRVIRYPGDYNFAAINNEAARHARGDYLVLLNNDTEIVSPVWLNSMVGMALREGVGSVGARLIYPNGILQHAGICRLGGMNLHTGHGTHATQPGYFGIAVVNHEACAVTAACALYPKKAWDAVCGMNEEYPVYFNDVDIGLRLSKAGYRNVVCADAVVIHKESMSLGKGITEEKQKKLSAAGDKLAADHSDSDPYWNPQVVFDPSRMGSPLWSPPWSPQPEKQKSVLVINGGPEDVIREYQSGRLAFLMTLSGFVGTVTTPELPNVQGWDFRAHPNEFVDAMNRLGVSRIILRTLGDASLECLGFLRRSGIPLEHLPALARESYCPRNMEGCDGRWQTGDCQSCVDENGSAHGYVDIQGWRNTWSQAVAVDAPQAP
ncbi:MAG: glycosyltransferase family 2 protein, partial [Sulfobacillus sp.]